MKMQYMFLTVVVPGPDDPAQGIDVYLQSLIEELKTLRNEGVETYDVSKKKIFRIFIYNCWTSIMSILHGRDSSVFLTAW